MMLAEHSAYPCDWSEIVCAERAAIREGGDVGILACAVLGEFRSAYLCCTLAAPLRIVAGTPAA